MTNQPILPHSERVWTVSQLNRHVSQLLQAQFQRIWVSGEISNFTQAASGHWYFSIKDGGAMVRAVMFRSRAQATGLKPKVGDQFEFRASVTLYEARGDYQLQVESMRHAGRGDLYEAFLALKEKLTQEGLFASERKLPIVTMPKTIGVITSLAAAALQDVVTTLQRRAPHVPVIVYPAPVQGAEAAQQLLHALQTAIQRNEVDTLLLVRGGGSIEDLWSFNDETLVRAVAASPIPVICGVGHETDFTICDFVADVRAPTPTAAAELVCYARDDCLILVQRAAQKLDQAQQRVIERAALRLDRAVSGLVSPQQRLRQQAERLNNLMQRMALAASAQQERHAGRLALLSARLAYCLPSVLQRRERLESQIDRLRMAAGNYPVSAARRLQAIEQTLQALSPRHILARGYAIVRNGNQEVIKNALDLSVGETLNIELDRGAAHVDVVQVHALL